MELRDLHDYLKRSGDNAGTIYPGKILLDNDHGFLSMDIMGDILFVHQCYGDGEYWMSEMTRLAKENKCKYIRFMTKRNPKTFERKYGFKLEGYIMGMEV